MRLKILKAKLEGRFLMLWAKIAYRIRRIRDRKISNRGL